MQSKCRKVVSTKSAARFDAVLIAFRRSVLMLGEWLSSVNQRDFDRDGYLSADWLDVSLVVRVSRCNWLNTVGLLP